MQKPGKRPTIILSQDHKYKICFELILEFLHQFPDEVFEDCDKSNMCVKDYGLEQFQWWICKHLNEDDVE